MGKVTYVPCRCGGQKDSRAQVCRECRYGLPVAERPRPTCNACLEPFKDHRAKGDLVCGQCQALPADELYELLVVKRPGCWGWRGAQGAGGYSMLNQEYAHRISYGKYVGSLDPALEIDHRCENKECSNPDHLEQVTHRVNSQRWYANRAKASR